MLVHGFTGHPDTWDAALGPAGGASVLRLVPLGHDGAPVEPDPGAVGPAGPAGFDAEVDRLAAQIRAAGPVATGRVHLVGYSLGARLALGLLYRHGALFRCATLIGVNPGLDDAAERSARQAEDEQRAARLLSDGLERFLIEWEAQPLFATLRRVPAAARAALSALRRRHGAPGLALCLRRLGLGVMPSYWSALARIPQPVRLVVGAEDPKFIRIAARALPRLVRGSLVVVADAGHNVPLEQPLALRPFLAARLAGCA
ncbi:MAG: alpha/beta fold hydrolase [Polyangia bacterium]